jgi:hypothetical protein
LALWGGSTGVLSARETIKTVPLSVQTANASVRSFVEGKPIWLSRDDLVSGVKPRKRKWIERLDGRWSRYLAVPIRLDRQADSHIAVGAITLGSMNIGDSRSSAVPIGSTDAMEALIERLEGVGSELLRPEVTGP